MVADPTRETTERERPDLSRWLGRVTCGDCLEVMREMPDGCGTLAIVDGPYNMRKAEWDKFPTWDAFREWYRPLWEQLSRVLRDNCSLYVFGTFEGLAALKQDLDGLGDGWRYVNHIVLHREALYLKKFDPEKFRSWLPAHYEDCLFYARERVDISALAWDGVTREDNTIRAYLNAERERAGLSTLAVNEEWRLRTGTKGGMAGHWFGNSQWACPTASNYQWLRDLFNARGNGSGPYLARPWEDLRREYEDLRREYEDLRYTFNPQQGVTDVWEVPICSGAERVKTATGETAHVAQKPITIMRRIIEASSNPGDVVIDPFCGTGTVPVACVELGREFVGVELDEHYCAIANARIAAARAAHHPSLPL